MAPVQSVLGFYRCLILYKSRLEVYVYYQDYGNYPARQYKPLKQRGGCLLTWLIFTIGGSFILIFWILGGGPQKLIDILTAAGETGIPNFPSWYWPVGVIENIGFIISGIGIWIWKKWGVYLYIVLVIIGALITFLTSGLSFNGIFGTLFSLGIAWFVVNPYFEDME